MSITASSLYRETGNFFRHQLVTVLLMSLLTAFISITITHALMPASDQLALLNDDSLSNMNLIQAIQSMTPEQQRVLLHFSAAGSFGVLIGTTLLMGGMLCLIPLVSSGQRTSALRAIGQSVPLLPRLLLLSFLITLVVQIGFMVLMLPGVALAVLLAISPVVLSEEKSGVITAMRRSFALSWHNLKLVAPAVLFWLLAKAALLVLAPKLIALPEDLVAVLLSALSNLITALLIIYLYRLYMLLR